MPFSNKFWFLRTSKANKIMATVAKLQGQTVVDHALVDKDCIVFSI
jgi:hypothetical protein